MIFFLQNYLIQYNHMKILTKVLVGSQLHGLANENSDNEKGNL